MQIRMPHCVQNDHNELGMTSASTPQEALLAWFTREGRDLPWRHTRDPYAILVAEIMLQQTQVDRVLPKYREFLAAFPTVADLAAAPRGEVIRRWSPLGYNLRAVRLHEIAQQVVSRWNGRFPTTIEELLTLKGIGPYTAGAVACFAYDQPAVFLDTNLRRVLGRCFAGLPYPHTSDDKAILEAAGAALPQHDPWRWHQGLMDLGATVCGWAKPECPQCPLSQWCRAREGLRAGAADAEASGVREERPVYRTQPKYAGSRRFYRGKVVEVLRALPPDAAMPLTALGPALKPDFSEEELPWLTELVAGLAKDGLVRLEDAQVALP